MPEQLDDASRHWQQVAATFAQEVLAPLANVDPSTARPQVIAASRAAGLYTLTQPESFGGTAASQLTLCAVRDELYAHNPPHTAGIFGPGPGVLAAVEEPLRSAYLEPLLRGEKTGGFAFTEPDDAPFYTRAERTADGFRISGQKSYVTGGASADFLNALVRIDDQPAMVIIDTDLAGVERTRVFESIDGSRHAAFRFSDVAVDESRLLAPPGTGMPKALGQIGDTRLAIAATCVGTSRWVYDLLCDHLDQPKREGGKRGDDPVARLRLGECYADGYAARSMLYRTARLVDGGDRAINEAMACKVFAVRSLSRLIDTAIQLVGGEAVISDHPLARLYQQTRTLQLAEGATDRLFQNMARGRLELAKGRL